MIRRSLLVWMVVLTVIVPACAAETLSLDGDWKFRTADATGWRTIKVPGSWEAQFPELRDYSGRVTYRTEFGVAPDWQGKAILLKFGAVDWRADVRIDGQRVGSHEGGYTPFQFEVQDYVVQGKNLLEVEVLDVGPGRPAEGLDFREIPHGKQSWYGTTSGIWQSVSLEARNLCYLKRVAVTPDIDASRAAVSVVLSREVSDARVTVTISDDSDRKVSMSFRPQGPTDRLKSVLRIPDAKLWSPDSPNLYTAAVRVECEGKLLDEQSVQFGMRKIEAKNNLIYLNNEPVFLIGALDQDYYPLTEYTPPSDAFIRDQFLKAKHMGLNMLRCHIKMPDPRYLKWADKLGLLVWCDIPNSDVLNEKTKSHAKAILDGMIERDYNHPSLAIICLINEAWGINMKEPSHRAWVKEMYDYAKMRDPTRLIVDNSPCGGNFHVKTDIEDFHAYHGMPDHFREYARWVEGLARHPDWTFSPHGDAERSGSEPLVLSEFGNWGLPKISQLKKHYGGEPWWFETGRGSSICPEGAEARFSGFGLDRIFKDYDALAEASQRQQWISLKYEIQQMRKSPSIVGYVITEFTDINWESNGLLDMCRNPKVFHDELSLVQAQDIIIPDWREVNYRCGDRLAMDVLVSHFSSKDLTDSRVQWELEGFDLSGELSHLRIPRHTTATAGTVRFVVPRVASPRRVRLRLGLYSADGGRVAENYQDLNFFPAESAAAGRSVAISDPGRKLQGLADRMRASGYRIVEVATEDAVLVTSCLDVKTIERLEGGASVILLARETDSFPRLTKAQISVKPRDLSRWWGDWCSSFIWFREGAPFRSVPLGKSYDFQFHRMLPGTVIVGMDPVEEADDILSGIFIGWLNTPAAITCQFRAGKGKVLATTLDVAFVYGDDPAATKLLQDMVDYVAGAGFQPGKEIDLSDYVPAKKVFLSTAEFGPQEWRLTTDSPGDGWQQPGFDDSKWSGGRSGFGTMGTPGAIVNTDWSTSDIWIRRTGTIRGKVTRAVIRYYHDDEFEIYLNGKLILSEHGYLTGYDERELGRDVLRLFRQGDNTLAVHCRQRTGGQGVDVGIWYDVE